MINLPVSEAYAFDYLSILMVKHEKCLLANGDMAAIRDSIGDQIGIACMTNVLESNEFHSLLYANRDVFRLVGMASDDSVSASEVDRGNQIRFHSKKALQERFWPDKPLAEVKSDRPISCGAPT